MNFLGVYFVICAKLIFLIFKLQKQKSDYVIYLKSILEYVIT